MNGHQNVVMTLLRAGADASIEDVSEQLARDYADFRGFDNIVQILAPKSQPKRYTPELFFEAIRTNDTFLLQDMLRTGFDPNITLNDSALNYALRKKKHDVALILVHAGADIHKRSNGSLPLHLAAYKGLIQMTKFFLKKGLSINDKNTNNGNTPLHLAVLGDHPDIVLFLMESNANPTEANFGGQTPLKLALTGRTKNCFNAMIQGGLLKKVSADALLREAEAARDFPLIFSLTLQTGCDFQKLIRFADSAGPFHLQVMAKQLPGFAEDYVMNISTASDKKNALEMLKKL